MFQFLKDKIHNHPFLQGGIILLIWLACESFVKSMKIPISGGILGFAITLLLLKTHFINLHSIRKGAGLFIKDMLLFFIPAVLKLLEYHEFVGILGLKILLVIALSTIAVMIVTAVVVDFCYHWRTNHATQFHQ